MFTESGFREYADDLLKRMLNPHLRDSVQRVVRDPRRKLGWDDRLVGTLRLALRQNIAPRRYAQGARAALRLLEETEGGRPEDLLASVWAESRPAEAEQRAIRALIMDNLTTKPVTDGFGGGDA